MISILDSASADFPRQLDELLTFAEEDRAEVRQSVANILLDVRRRGDAAVLELTNRFDRREAGSMAGLALSPDELKAAFVSLEPPVRDALEEAANRVRAYHEAQLAAMGGGDGWQYEDDQGNRLGQRVHAMARVGVYAPGGKAAYPSTIIMTAVPARVAGVEEIILCVPTPGGEVNPALLAAAHLSGVDRVFSIGGAQAIAALAYGTATVPRVDKIVGPGNIYVAAAKEQVFGDVGIDMIAGPSEVVIVADKSADPDRVLLDMFAQAEHDEMARAIVISSDAGLLNDIRQRLPEMLARQTRRDIIATAIREKGAVIQVTSLDEAFTIVNRIAPEHLQLALSDAPDHLDKVRHAGAIFLGVDTTEVVGDYMAGPSHVLPTGGTARFASPLGVYDFQTRTSVIECSGAGAVQLNRAAAIIAAEEGLDAHAESALSRVEG